MKINLSLVKNVLTPLKESVIMPLGLRAPASERDAAIKIGISNENISIFK